MALPQEFINILNEILQADEKARLLAALETEPQVSIRFNPLIPQAQTLALDSLECKSDGSVPWAEHAVYLDHRPQFTLDPLLHMGCYYVQEASSMFLEQAVRKCVSGPVKALDLCAAPGGKSTLLASLLPEGSLLVSNDNANINISGGTISIKASDDGIHADGTLTISGGEVNIAESHEGLEGKIVNINGGKTIIVSDDDGINASSAINFNGGVVDVTVSPNGDTDGIDSNGTVTISGGIIITRGPNSEMAAPLDSEYTMKMTGGILIVIGYPPKRLSTSGVTKTSSSNGLSMGTHTVTIGSSTITYTNTYTYKGACTVYGSACATVN